MKDWQEIVKLYQKDNVYLGKKKRMHSIHVSKLQYFLAEAAQILQRLVTYEIPAMKKQIVNANKAHEDCARKRDRLRKAIEGRRAGIFG